MSQPQNTPEVSIEEQKKVAQFIRSLEKELKVLQKAQIAAGWSQRNAVMEHVHSNYKKQEMVLKKKGKWEKISLRFNVVRGILEVLSAHKDLNGLFDVGGVQGELRSFLRAAEEKEEYELAQLIQGYSAQFLKSINS